MRRLSASIDSELVTWGRAKVALRGCCVLGAGTVSDVVFVMKWWGTQTLSLSPQHREGRSEKLSVSSSRAHKTANPKKIPSLDSILDIRTGYGVLLPFFVPLQSHRSHLPDIPTRVSHTPTHDIMMHCGWYVIFLR